MSSTPSELVGANAPARSMLRWSLLISCFSAPLITVVALTLRGGPGLRSGLVGALVSIAFFTIGHIGVRAVIAGAPELTIVGALVVYLGQLIVLVFLFLVLQRSGWVDGPAFAAATVAQTLAWQVGQVVGFRRGRHEIYPDVVLPGETT